MSYNSSSYLSSHISSTTYSGLISLQKSRIMAAFFEILPLCSSDSRSGTPKSSTVPIANTLFLKFCSLIMLSGFAVRNFSSISCCFFARSSACKTYLLYIVQAPSPITVGIPSTYTVFSKRRISDFGPAIISLQLLTQIMTVLASLSYKTLAIGLCAIGFRL